MYDAPGTVWVFQIGFSAIPMLGLALPFNALLWQTTVFAGTLLTVAV